jgi:ribosomal protein S18 acetylase RimI-like enzyme
MFKQRGYAIAELNNALYHRLDAARKPAPVPAGFEMRRSSREEADVTGAIVESAFFPDGAPAGFQGCIGLLHRMENALAFVATNQGKPVACGAGMVIPEHRVFALCGAGTLADYRGRGLQTALLQARMEAAVKAGCEYAVVVTQVGTTSERNAERLGFRVAYSKVTVIKPLCL